MSKALPPLWGHQQACLDRTHARPKLMLLHSPRLGKSRVAVEFLLSTQRGLERPLRALIAAPLVVCPQWVQVLTEAKEMPIPAFGWSSTRIAAWLKANKAGIVVVNDDKLGKLVDPILSWRPDLFIGDESHRYKGKSTLRGKAARRICWLTDYVRLLTGTPTPNNVGNLWGQLVGIDKALWGASYERFAKKYLIRDSLFPDKILGVLHPEKIREMLLQCADIVRREDVFGPDQWQTIIREVSLPPKAADLYASLVKDWITVDALQKNETIDVTHKLQRIIRLQQLTSGFIKDVNGELHKIHSTKIDAVMHDLEEIIESGEKIVVFHKFTEEGNQLYERTCKEFGPRNVFRINGSVTGQDRGKAIAAFELHGSGCVAIVQTDSGGIGISFASASHVFFVSQGFSFDIELQARDRIYSPGKSKCVSLYQCPNTVDSFIARTLSGKENFHESITHADLRELAFNERPILPGKGII